MYWGRIVASIHACAVVAFALANIGTVQFSVSTGTSAPLVASTAPSGTGSGSGSAVASLFFLVVGGLALPSVLLAFNLLRDVGSDDSLVAPRILILCRIHWALQILFWAANIASVVILTDAAGVGIGVASILNIAFSAIVAILSFILAVVAFKRSAAQPIPGQKNLLAHLALITALLGWLLIVIGDSVAAAISESANPLFYVSDILVYSSFVTFIPLLLRFKLDYLEMSKSHVVWLSLACGSLAIGVGVFFFTYLVVLVVSATLGAGIEFVAVTCAGLGLVLIAILFEFIQIFRVRRQVIAQGRDYHRLEDDDHHHHHHGTLPVNEPPPAYSDAPPGYSSAPPSYSAAPPMYQAPPSVGGPPPAPYRSVGDVPDDFNKARPAETFSAPTSNPTSNPYAFSNSNPSTAEAQFEYEKRQPDF